MKAVANEGKPVGRANARLGRNRRMNRENRHQNSPPKTKTQPPSSPLVDGTSEPSTRTASRSARATRASALRWSAPAPAAVVLRPAGRPACGILLRASRVHLFLHLIVHLALPPIRNPHRISNFPLSVPQIVILCRLVFRYIYIRHNNYGRKKRSKAKRNATWISCLARCPTFVELLMMGVIMHRHNAVLQ
jgi:hypothetical protein